MANETMSKWYKAQNEIYIARAIIITNGWNTGDTIGQLKNMVDRACPEQWLSDFIDSAQKFYSCQDFKNMHGKTKKLSSGIQKNFYRMLCAEYFLSMETIFNSGFSRGPYEDRFKGPRMYLRLDEGNNPVIIRAEPTGQNNYGLDPIPLEYFASLESERIHDWIEDEYKPEMDYKGTPEKYKKLENLFTDNDYLLFVKGMHYSLPVDSDLYRPPFKLKKGKEG
ncbi:MAG: hypothetical protein V1906_02605, partial [Candidatus Woesearchaeota archaeon]